MRNQVKSAFTLIELLVVIAIIGILASVMLGFFSGTTETARATLCMNNIRSLATASHNYAMQNEWGHFPHAGSYLWMWYGGDLTYNEAVGWVARMPRGEKKIGSIISFSEDDNFKNKDAHNGLRQALTAGTLWKRLNGSRKLYQCPVHAEACYKKNHRYPGWSYVMSADFGWSHDGSDPLKGWEGRSLGSWSAPDRVLMFAEIQAVTDPAFRLVANLNEKGERGDSVLQYEDNEFIGFNHKQKVGHWAGHVAFADGHVGKFLVPEKGSIDLRKLTEKLCKGHELEYRSGAYIDLQER